MANSDTAFGPADHPDLPLGLRRHPRWALRFAQRNAAGELEDMGATYAHTREAAEAVARLIPHDDVLGLEEWTGAAWEERDRPDGAGPRVGDGTSEAALAIGEDAFRAGWEACRIREEKDQPRWVEDAWSAYDPPEHIKALS